MLKLNLPSESFTFESSNDDSLALDFTGADISIRQDWDGEGGESVPMIEFVVSNDCIVTKPEVRFSISGEANIDALRRFCEMTLAHAEKDWIMHS